MLVRRRIWLYDYSTCVPCLDACVYVRWGEGEGKTVTKILIGWISKTQCEWPATLYLLAKGPDFHEYRAHTCYHRIHTLT